MSFQESMQKAGEEILEKIGQQAASEFRVGAGKAIPGKVTSRSGDLMAAVLGQKKGTGASPIRIIKVDSDPAVFIIGVAGQYAALIHEGGVRVVTEKMRRFFWAKFFTTPSGTADYAMWRALRWKRHITYQPRPFLRTAVMEVEPQIPQILRKYGIQALRTEVQKIIAGANNTVTPSVG